MKGYSKLSEMNSVLSTIHVLSRFGIKVLDDGQVTLRKDFVSQGSIDLLTAHLREKTPFFMGLTIKNMATLALAVYQECQNNYIQQEDIDLINYILEFKKPITNKDVQFYNSKFV
jgi:hypothetical protein